MATQNGDAEVVYRDARRLVGLLGVGRDESPSASEGEDAASETKRRSQQTSRGGAVVGLAAAADRVYAPALPAGRPRQGRGRTERAVSGSLPACRRGSTWGRRHCQASETESEVVSSAAPRREAAASARGAAETTAATANRIASPGSADWRVFFCAAGRAPMGVFVTSAARERQEGSPGGSTAYAARRISTRDRPLEARSGLTAIVLRCCQKGKKHRRIGRGGAFGRARRDENL